MACPPRSYPAPRLSVTSQSLELNDSRPPRTISVAAFLPTPPPRTRRDGTGSGRGHRPRPLPAFRSWSELLPPAGGLRSQAGAERRAHQGECPAGLRSLSPAHHPLLLRHPGAPRHPARLRVEKAQRPRARFRPYGVQAGRKEEQEDGLLALGKFGTHLTMPGLRDPPSASSSEGGTHSTDEETEATQLGSGGARGGFQPLLVPCRHPPKGRGWEKRRGTEGRTKKGVQE